MTRKREAIRPYEHQYCPSLPTDEKFQAAAQDLLTAVNGFYYPGDRADAVLTVVKWLRSNADVADDLGITKKIPASAVRTLAHESGRPAQTVSDWLTTAGVDHESWNSDEVVMG